MAKNLALAFAALLLVVASAQSQTATGVIQGTVKDDTGAALAVVFRDDFSLDALGLAYPEKQIIPFHRWVQTLKSEFKTSVDHCLMIVA